MTPPPGSSGGGFGDPSPEEHQASPPPPWGPPPATSQTAPPGYIPPPGPYQQPGYPGAPPPYWGQPVVALTPQEERTWAMFAHLGAIIASIVSGMAFLGPLIVMLTQGQKSAFVRRHAVESLNFHLQILLQNELVARRVKSLSGLNMSCRCSRLIKSRPVIIQPKMKFPTATNATVHRTKTL